MGNKIYWVYMLLCENNTYYTGYTNDLEQRYQSHVDGTGGYSAPICLDHFF